MSEMLTITEIVNRTGFDRNVLNRFLALPANREFFGGAATHPLYPAASLTTFHHLADQYAKGIVKPKTLEALWRSREAAGSDLSAVRPEYSESDNRTSNTEQALAFTPSGVRMGASILPKNSSPPCSTPALVVGDDRLLTAQKPLFICPVTPHGSALHPPRPARNLPLQRCARLYPPLACHCQPSRLNIRLTPSVSSVRIHQIR